jgi:carbonic anhydrase
MRTCSFLFGALLTGACAHAPAHWTYEGETGPAAWASLSPENASCGDGQHQSPIDLRSATPADLPGLKFGGTPFIAVLEDNGHALQASAPAGIEVLAGEDERRLVQFHLHHPSEHAIDGHRAPLEVHFVSRDAAGHLGVVGLLVEEGGENAALAGLLSGKEVSLSALLPTDGAYFRYEGSLTTPPCTEGVDWRVFAHPLRASAAQISELTHRSHENSRPLMPLNGRTLELSR